MGNRNPHSHLSSRCNYLNVTFINNSPYKGGLRNLKNSSSNCTLYLEAMGVFSAVFFFFFLRLVYNPLTCHSSEKVIKVPPVTLAFHQIQKRCVRQYMSFSYHLSSAFLPTRSIGVESLSCNIIVVGSGSDCPGHSVLGQDIGQCLCWRTNEVSLAVE